MQSGQLETPRYARWPGLIGHGMHMCFWARRSYYKIATRSNIESIRHESSHLRNLPGSWFSGATYGLAKNHLMGTENQNAFEWLYNHLAEK